MSDPTFKLKPLISVIMPVRNEVQHIERTIASLFRQTAADFELEFLLIDGRSDDGTREIIARHAAADPRIVLLDNPRRNTPAAFNIGIKAAVGEYVCILGAHAEYPPDYIATCFQELIARNVTACSGCLVTVPSNQSSGGRLAAWCLSHKLASGNSIRTHRGGLVDTLPYPVVRKDAVIEAGVYDEELQRNQDNDMNQRLRALGHKLYLTPRTRAHYYARPNVGALLRYAYTTGMWNALSLRRNASSMCLRHFAPFSFVLSLAALLLTGGAAVLANISPKVPLILFSIALGLHLLMGAFAAIQTAILDRDAAALLLPFAMFAFHLAYGTGTIAGLFSQRSSGERAITCQATTDLSN